MRHIVIEGPDGAGKTRLARFICHRHVMAYHHEGPPPAGASLLHHYGGLLANAERPTVFDRLHLGELVYGPLLRGASGVSSNDLVLMRRLLRGMGVVTILCLPPWSTCYQNNRDREELIPDEPRLRRAYDAWASLAPTGHFDLHYDYTSAPPFQLPWVESCSPGVIGSPSASVLFIGERTAGAPDLPFFNTVNASGFFNAAVAAAGYREDDIAFTNAFTTTGAPRDLAAVCPPSVRVVVPLGRPATLAAEDQLSHRVRIEPLPHPAFWKRFHFNESKEYTRMLSRIREVACAA